MTFSKVVMSGFRSQDLFCYFSFLSKMQRIGVRQALVGFQDRSLGQLSGAGALEYGIVVPQLGI